LKKGPGAAKGHEESIWIVRVIQDAGRENMDWKEAFAQTEEPLGWYFAGLRKAIKV
jgi:hypothetical protein